MTHERALFLLFFASIYNDKSNSRLFTLAFSVRNLL